MSGTPEDLVGRANLGDSSQIHDRDLVTQMLSGAEVMCDVQKSGVELPAEPQDDVHDFGARRNVHHREWLVGHDVAWTQHHCARDRYALSLTSAQPSWLRPEECVTAAETDGLNHFLDLTSSVVPRLREAMDVQRLRNDVQNRGARVERVVRVLQHDLNVSVQSPSFSSTHTAYGPAVVK
jgi:hypothetical protein